MVGVAQLVRASDCGSEGRGFESHHPPQKNRQVSTCRFFLFKPQAWYVITRHRVWYRRRRMESPKVHFPRLDSIPSCNGFHTMLCIDSIHASRRDVAHEFKSIRKLSEISFLSALHKKKRLVKPTSLFFFIYCESNGISSRVSVYIIAVGVYHQP